MQVKVCPKCKAENRPSNAACSVCYVSLEGVDITESTSPAQVRPPMATAAPKPIQPPVGVPVQTQQMPAPNQTQMGTMSPPPNMPVGPMMMPVKRSSPVWIIMVVLFIALAAIGAGVYVGVKSGLFAGNPLPKDPPEQTVMKFLEAKKTRDFLKVEPYLSKNSIDMVCKTFGSRQAQSAGFSQKDAENMYVWKAVPTTDQMVGKRIAASVVKGDKEADERMAIVLVVVDEQQKAAPAPKPLLPPGVSPPPEPEKQIDLSDVFDLGPIETEFVLVAEGGQWKIDFQHMTRRDVGLGKPGNLFRPGR